ncbi:MAG: methyltransferase domain-containing protein [Lautropia sp.]|nr:methyltransferase domain-containing protein [Lautropia sp.]
MIDDVPVLMKGRVGVFSHWNDGALHTGPSAPELVAALERGATGEALLDCLVFPRKYPLQGRLSRAGLWPSSLSAKVGLAQTRSGLRRLIAGSTDGVLAQDLFNFFHSRRSGNNPYLAEYFLNRFVMPRYLSAMSLVQRFGADDKPVLDIACGYGHIEHYLTRRRRSTPAIGIDFNFFQAWGARHWVAPDAWFVCCDAGARLPLKADSCAGAVCSDAFMCLPDKKLLVDEVERVAPGRPAIFARVGNKGVGPPNPPHGGELQPGEYWDLFGRDRSRYFPDALLWKDYLIRRNPLEREPVPLADLRWEKYLSFVKNPQALSPQGEEEGVWCHGVGRLALNSVLSITAEDPDALATEFMYRTIWGAYEDADMMGYTERRGRIDKGELRQALADPDGEAAFRLVGRFALVGVPERYSRDRLGEYRPGEVR